MPKYEKLKFAEKMMTTAKDQRHKIYEFIEKEVIKKPLTQNNKKCLSMMLDELVKVHNVAITIENGRLVSALTERNATIEDMKKARKSPITISEWKGTNRPRYNPNTFNSDFTKR